VGRAARRRRSDDGGQSFRRIAFTNVESACKEELRDFWFVDPSTGWILETDGTIVQTKDGGTEFIQRNDRKKIHDVSTQMQAMLRRQ